jgi:uncharacterized membrane protein HdeD (DUF308 family)
MIQPMSPPRPHPLPSRKANHELLQKAILITLIGLAVLVAPAFMAPSPFREVIASSAVVGWFALVLGLAFAGLYGMRRRAAAQEGERQAS